MYLIRQLHTAAGAVVMVMGVDLHHRILTLAAEVSTLFTNTQFRPSPHGWVSEQVATPVEAVAAAATVEAVAAAAAVTVAAVVATLVVAAVVATVVAVAAAATVAAVVDTVEVANGAEAIAVSPAVLG